MAITRWDPFREVASLQNRFNTLFRDLNDAEAPLTTAAFVPAVDIYEDDKKVVLKLEVPGIEEKDLDVSVENNTLTVKGERKFETEEKEENFHRIERRYGSFFRAFTRSMCRRSTMRACSSWSFRRSPKPSRSRSRST